MNNTPAGLSIRRAVLLQSGLDAGVTVTLAEIPADEFAALTQIKLQIAKKESESNR